MTTHARHRIIDRALWHLLAHGATAEEAYPRLFIPYLEQARAYASSQHRYDIADFAKLQLDRIRLAQELDAPHPVAEEKTGVSRAAYIGVALVLGGLALGIISYPLWQPDAVVPVRPEVVEKPSAASLEVLSPLIGVATALQCQALPSLCDIFTHVRQWALVDLRVQASQQEKEGE